MAQSFNINADYVHRAVGKSIEEHIRNELVKIVNEAIQAEVKRVAEDAAKRLKIVIHSMLDNGQLLPTIHYRINIDGVAVSEGESK